MVEAVQRYTVALAEGRFTHDGDPDVQNHIDNMAPGARGPESSRSSDPKRTDRRRHGHPFRLLGTRSSAASVNRSPESSTSTISSMAHYSDVPFVMTTSPTEARAIDHALTLLIEQHRRDGHPRPPLWILELQATFHALWDSYVAKVEQSQMVSLSDLS